jgi:hypothetical protein
VLKNTLHLNSSFGLGKCKCPSEGLTCPYGHDCFHTYIFTEGKIFV